MPLKEKFPAKARKSIKPGSLAEEFVRYLDSIADEVDSIKSLISRWFDAEIEKAKEDNNEPGRISKTD